MVVTPPPEARDAGDQSDIGSPDVGAARAVVKGLEAEVAALGSLTDDSYDQAAKDALDAKLAAALAHFRVVKEAAEANAIRTLPFPSCLPLRPIVPHMTPYRPPAFTLRR